MAGQMMGTQRVLPLAIGADQCRSVVCTLSVRALKGPGRLSVARRILRASQMTEGAPFDEGGG
jgi:hypothetical protein